MIKNPVKTCDKVYSLIQNLTLQIRQRMEDPKSAGTQPEQQGKISVLIQLVLELCLILSHTDIQLYHSETLELMLRRWCKLEKDFKMKNGRYNISKIPDIYDCIKYDVQHNSSLKLDNTMEIYRLSKALADIVIPQVSWTVVVQCIGITLHCKHLLKIYTLAWISKMLFIFRIIV